MGLSWLAFQVRATGDDEVVMRMPHGTSCRLLSQTEAEERASGKSRPQASSPLIEHLKARRGVLLLEVSLGRHGRGWST